ncbi:MAG: hypothetical protein C4329_10155 [Chitinophagaceae bacterium]
MVKIFYAKVDNKHTDALLERINELPLSEQKRIVSYKHKQKKLQKLVGRLLLADMLKSFGLNNELSLDQLIYDNNRSYFNHPFSFSIAHSSDYIVCVGCLNEKIMIGIDIEEILPIELSLYKDYFTDNEWNFIDNDTNRFFHLWTKKEAILKASTLGVTTPLHTIDVVQDEAKYNETIYYCFNVYVDKNISCYLACTAKIADLVVECINV